MAAGIDLDKVLGALSNKSIETNSNSVMGMLEQANQVLSEFEKTCQTLENMHILPALVRGVGVKYGIDVDTPLAGGLTPKTDYHKLVFEKLNDMDEAAIGLLIAGSAKNESPRPDSPANSDK